MRIRNVLISIFALLLCLTAQMALAQDNSITAPPLVKFSGAIADAKGTVGVTFALYKDPTGGAPLWMETQNVTVDANGSYTVYLGVNHQEGVPSELFADGAARWLGIQAQGQAEQPRVLLATVPYAMKAVDADTLGGRPASSFVTLDKLGSTPASASQTPSALKFSFVTTNGGTVNSVPLFTTGSNIQNSIMSQSGNTMNVAGNLSSTGSVTGKTLVSTVGTGTAPFTVTSTTQVANLNASLLGGVTSGNYVNTTGNQTIGGTKTFSHTITGSITGNAGTVTNGVYTTGSYANPSWITAIDGSILTGTVNATELGGTASGAFPQLATTNAFTNANVFGTGAGDTLSSITANAQQTSYVIEGYNNDTSSASAGVVGFGNSFGYGVYGEDDAAGGSGVWGQSAGGVGVVGMAAGEAGVYGYTVSGDLTTGGVVGTSAQDGGNGVVATCVGIMCNGIMVQAFEDGSGGGTAIYGQGDNGAIFYANGANNGGNGVYSEADTDGYAGVFAVSYSPDSFGTGMLGEAEGSSFLASAYVGVYPIGVAGTTNAAAANNTAVGIGVFGASDLGYGGLFLNNNSFPSMYAENDNGANAISPILYSYDGNAGNYCYTDTTGSLTCNGTVTDANGSLVKIDDPADPGNKYLVHASIQSSEMKNLYDGRVTTDASGMAVVQMPQWFEALNAEFRYQLTVMGQFAQAIVASEIANGQFAIRTDKPNVDVCWQVTAVRHDPWAKANPMQVELNKSAAERGHYINPALYGASKELGMAQVHHAVGGMQPTAVSARALKHPQVKAVKLAPPARLPLRHIGPNQKPATRKATQKH